MADEPEHKPMHLEVHEVTVTYGARRAAQGPAPTVLRDVSVGVRRGELVALLGANGAGKSTVVKVACGLVKPTRGRVTLAGRDIADMTRSAVARAVAVVEQSSQPALAFTVREVVSMGRAPHQGAWMASSDEDASVIDAALRRCDLTGLEHRVVTELSGGEQKRVSIARALAQTPDVLLLDEPGAFLDVRHQLSLYELLLEETRSRNLACLVVMHDLNVAAQFADRVVLLAEGRVVGDGTVEEVMTYRKLEETFGADLYCGQNDLTGARFFLPMRKPAQDS
jgi:iron complex transport system ATP-binding protein